MRTLTRSFIAATLAVSLLATGPPLGGVFDTQHSLARASQDGQPAVATMEPFDRTPGATDVKYGLTVLSTAGIDLKTLTRTLAVYEAGSWTGCGPGDSEVFGIDRGNTHDGYGTDEELTDNVKSYSAGEDELDTYYYREEDFGASTHFYDGDQLVTTMSCIDNPEDPGWYRISGRVEGVTSDDEEVSLTGYSDYFWICNCANEAEARGRLGPPPDEPEPTATRASIPTPSHDGTSSTDTGPTDATPSPTRAVEATPTASPSESATPMSTPTRTQIQAKSWDHVVNRTPTTGTGVGFQVLPALAVFGGIVLLIHQRR